MKKISILILLLQTAAIINAQSVSYTYDHAGNRIARTFTISNKSPAAPVEAITELPDRVAETSVVIYPNPTKGIVTVEIKDFTDKLQAEFRLTDLSGRTITNRKAANPTQTFDLSNCVDGIYLLQIRINNESVVWKIVKQ